MRTALTGSRGWEVQLDADRRFVRGCSASLGNLRGSLRGQRPPSLSSNSTVFTLPRRCAVVHAEFYFIVARSSDEYVFVAAALRLQVITRIATLFLDV